MPVAPSSAAMVSCPSALQTSGAAAAASGDREECLQQQAGTAGITLRRPRQLQPAGTAGATSGGGSVLPARLSVERVPAAAKPRTLAPMSQGARPECSITARAALGSEKMEGCRSLLISTRTVRTSKER
jgi:hypothetical protein